MVPAEPDPPIESPDPFVDDGTENLADPAEPAPDLEASVRVKNDGERYDLKVSAWNPEATTSTEPDLLFLKYWSRGALTNRSSGTAPAASFEVIPLWSTDSVPCRADQRNVLEGYCTPSSAGTVLNCGEQGQSLVPGEAVECTPIKGPESSTSSIVPAELVSSYVPAVGEPDLWIVAGPYDRAEAESRSWIQQMGSVLWSSNPKLVPPG